MAGENRHSIGNGSVSAVIQADGAEPCSLKDAAGRELLWQGGPAWPRHAPVLFPIVGRLAGDRLLHDGVSHRMTQQGFARDRRFTWLEQSPTVCRLRLEDDAETRAAYPFAFRLDIAYAVEQATFTVTYTVTNTGADVLPASLGAHPAFQWPLNPGVAKPDHRLTFDLPETAPVRRVEGGLLRPEPVPTPVQGRVLPLDPSLFADDALIMDHPASRSVRYEAPGEPGIDVSWHGFEQLGVWSKPGGAEFLCIEPWRGYASPAGFDGEFAAKPGLMLIPPGEHRTLGWTVSVL
jgi:galactose mutarotase-like enzyme